jgi:hypothetical protein
MSVIERIEHARKKRAIESSAAYRNTDSELKDVARRAIVDKIFFNRTQPIDCSSIISRFCSDMSGYDEPRTLFERIASNNRLYFEHSKPHGANYMWDTMMIGPLFLTEFEKWCDYKANRVVADLSTGSVSSFNGTTGSVLEEVEYWHFLLPLLNANGFDAIYRCESQISGRYTVEISYTAKNQAELAPVPLGPSSLKRRAEGDPDGSTDKDGSEA